MKAKNTIESIAMTTLKKGKSFYSHKMDRDLTAISSYYKVKIKTERLIVINPQTCKAEKLTKVIIL